MSPSTADQAGPEPDLWIAYFPGGSSGEVHGDTYGPFECEADAKRYARTLSTDPNKGRVVRLVSGADVEEAEARIEAIRAAWGKRR